MNAFGLSCLKYSLGPLLWLQGQHVRKRTPVLPEPGGDRTGQTGRGPALRLLILGDSSAAGVGVAIQKHGLLGHILQDLSPDYLIDYELRARTGAKTRDALNDLQQAIDIDWPTHRQFDVVVTALGVNDVTGQLSLKKWRKQQQSLIETVHKHLQPQLMIVSGLPPMHRFPALPVPLRSYLGAWARLFNHNLHQLSSQYTNTTFIAVSDLPQPLDVASDGFHPGPETYQKWGQAAAGLIKSSA